MRGPKRDSRRLLHAGIRHRDRRSDPPVLAAQRSMVLRVTNERLLPKTGDIVQGMSGSPILQDGRLIGAVTHVFVNDPTMGYGLFIEWMLQQE